MDLAQPTGSLAFVCLLGAAVAVNDELQELRCGPMGPSTPVRMYLRCTGMLPELHVLRSCHSERARCTGTSLGWACSPGQMAPATRFALKGNCTCSSAEDSP